MNTTTKLLILLTICSVGHANAQSKEKPASITPTGKWEVATDLLWLIDKNQYPPSIFVRRHTNRGAWRMRIAGSVARRREIVAIPQLRVTQEYWLVPGYEWHLRLPNKRTIPYLGVDLPLFYNIDRDPSDYLLPPQTQVSSTVSSYLSLGVAGVFGIRHHISKQFSVSVELNARLSYQKTKITSQTNNSPNEVRQNQSEIISQIIPLQVLSLSYHFNNKQLKK